MSKNIKNGLECNNFECQREVLAASRLACAVIVQAARDLMLLSEISPGMNKNKIARQRLNEQNKFMARRWILDTDGDSAMSLETCCDYINMALDMKYGKNSIHIRPEVLRKKLFAEPKKLAGIVSASTASIRPPLVVSFGKFFISAHAAVS